MVDNLSTKYWPKSMCVHTKMICTNANRKKRSYFFFLLLVVFSIIPFSVYWRRWILCVAYDCLKTEMSVYARVCHTPCMCDTVWLCACGTVVRSGACLRHIVIRTTTIDVCRGHSRNEWMFTMCTHRYACDTLEGLKFYTSIDELHAFRAFHSAIQHESRGGLPAERMAFFVSNSTKGQTMEQPWIR